MNTEKEKYYTPEISEFHVGFEYEYLDPRNKEGYIKHTLTEDTVYCNYCQGDVDFHVADPFNFNCFRRKEEEVQYRVKYLDKEDIETIFPYSKENPHNSTDIVFYNPENNNPILVLDSIAKVGEKNIYITDRCCWFYIKNKLELKRLLVQTSII